MLASAAKDGLWNGLKREEQRHAYVASAALVY